MGDRKAYLTEAVSRLSRFLHDITMSRIFEVPALLPDDAPEEWNQPFYNMAIAGEAADGKSLTPEMLLSSLKQIERDMGREIRGFWGPREIDIDILAMDDIASQSKQLHIPHHELLNRDFALVPLVDVAPDWHYPLEGSYQGWRAKDIMAAKGYKVDKSLIDIGKLVA